jgi:ATP-dependent helicase/nuclease subunit B
MELFEHMTQGVTLLTPNRRLAAFHLREHHSFQQEQGNQCWNSPDILPFVSWIERLWKEYSHREMLEKTLLLSKNQELLIWEGIIQHSKESEHLLQVSDTADIAKSAWGILKQWNVALTHPIFKTTEDSHTFLTWAELFQKRCQENNWLDQHSLADKIIELIHSKQIKVSKKIILVGFTEISPQYQKILDACQAQGSTLEYYLQKEKNNTIHKISLTDKETEIRTMACWARAVYQNRIHDKISIACIIPNLEDHRETVNRIFSEVFTDKGYYTTNSLSLPFNISAGKNLASYPIIHTAFQLLNLNPEKVSIETLGSILRSPFIGDAENEMLRRSDFDNQLRKENVSSISLEKLIKRNNKPELLAKRFRLYLDKLNSLDKKLPISEWINHMMELLTLLGWPGERSVNSEEYQIIQRWIELFSEYVTYENILTETTYTAALHDLKRLSATTVFQPQSPETPIQILGILEAAEIPFNYLWAMGMDDTSWPPSPKPNPFIPQLLQKTLHMPHATAERELSFCEKITSQLKNSADVIIFSHALHDAESEVRASSLLEKIPALDFENLILSENIQTAHHIYGHKKIEKLLDDKGPPVITTEPIQGGAKIFELQAACQFRAFAELRLFARPIEETALGLRALDRGNIVHKALELIWNELKNSASLHQKTFNELNTLIQTSIEIAIHTITGEKSQSLSYLTLELQRLQKILWSWIEIEKGRQPFTVISQEQKFNLTFANIPISLRVDRIDELPNGDKVIIDYKTGKNNGIHDWFGDRPDAPQLPLYCTIDPEHTVSIAFGIVHPEKMELKGVSKYNLDIAAIRPIPEINGSDAKTWNEQLNFWQETLEKLAANFCEGNALINPKYGMQTCEHCKLKPLCRIYEKES